MTVIHILIGMFNSNPMIPQYLNNKVLELVSKLVVHSSIHSTVLPCFYFGMNRQCFDAVRLTWPAYDDGRKHENSSA